MKNAAKFAVTAVFVLFLAAMFMKSGPTSGLGTSAFAQAKPTPPANTATTPSTNAAPAAANTKPAAGDSTIPKHFTLDQDSVDPQYGAVEFDHDSHGFQNYSPDGKSQIACVECHHTDQPKSALKPPLSTSERDVALTFATWKASSQKVTHCRDCHFQDGNVPDGKEMPSATYTEGGKSVTKDLNNELAYHINCNTCHDAAAAARPQLKGKPGFATSKDCTICHKKP